VGSEDLEIVSDGGGVSTIVICFWGFSSDTEAFSFVYKGLDERKKDVKIKN
jgi:hypothetical protein